MKDIEIKSIGLMSGTSLDGLDVCQCTFKRTNGKWSFTLDCARGYSYPDDYKYKLGTGAQNMSAYEYVAFHSEYGFFLGERVKEFMEEFEIDRKKARFTCHKKINIEIQKTMCYNLVNLI